MTQLLYRALTAAAAPLLGPWLRRRVRIGKEDPARLSERRGVSALPRPGGPLVWIHAASLGEARSVLPLVTRLLETRPQFHVLFTTGTVTSAQLLAERLPPRAFHQYAPLDVPGWVARFLDHWRPDLALWVESELWPNLIAMAAARGTTMALVNARLSARSYAGWKRVTPILRPPLGAFALCLAQSEADRARLVDLGAANCRCVGNLKFDGAEQTADAGALAGLRAVIGVRPVWLAASIHPGEDRIVAEVHRALAPRHPDLLTLAVPRHPQRGPEMAACMAALGLTVARRAQGEAPAPGIDVYLADTTGEMGVFYRLAPVAFVGGSLVPHGGQNPLEAAGLGAAVLFGPHMDNFPDVAPALTDAGAARVVADAGTLAANVTRLLSDPRAREAAANAGARVVAEGRGATAKVLAELAPLLDAAASRHART